MAKYREWIIETYKDFLNNVTPRLTRKCKAAKLYTGDVVITRAKKITVVCDYPFFGNEYEFTLKSDKGFTKQIFYEKLRDLYSKEIYKRANYYGVFGHGIEDLVLEYVVRRKNGKFYPEIGS